MLLSIVVPTYNVERYIANCLESLLKQDVAIDSYEVIIVNDGSTDESARIAELYSNTYTNVRVIHQENAGLSAARNKGISVAKGKYIYFIDSDDYIAKNTLKLVMETLETNNLDILGVDVIETSTLNSSKSRNAASLNVEDVKVSDGITYIAENNYLNNAWWYFVKLDFLKESQLLFPVGRLVEDANFTAKLLIKATKMGWLPLDFYRYYIRPNSIMRRKQRSHIIRLVGDYEKNVYEFKEQLIELKQSKYHPKLDDCIERLDERKDSFVFFLLVKGLRFGLPKEDLQKKIEGFKRIDAYPVSHFYYTGNSTFLYKMLLPLINNEKYFFTALKIRSYLPSNTHLLLP